MKLIYTFHRLNLFVALVSLFSGALGSLFFPESPSEGFILFALSTYLMFFAISTTFDGEAET